MKCLEIEKINTLKAELDNIATDKSISHRAAIFSLLSDKESTIENFLNAEDTLNTLKIIKSLGGKIKKTKNIIKIKPPKQIKEANNILDCGNSGTAIRLLMGFLSSVDGFFVLHGDKYLAKRPMRRVSEPLKKIGAKIDGRANAEFCPLCIRGSKLKAFQYELPMPSAQLKSALILAALNSDGICTIKEPQLSRNHTEIMLKAMGANIYTKEDKIIIEPLKKSLSPININIPKDPSSAFFFAVAACITPNSHIILKDILLNPTRIEAYKVLEKMGADIKFIIKDEKYDLVGDIEIKYSKLIGIEVSENIAWLIDELPALSIAFAFADGLSVVKNAAELRVKESDRIKSIVQNLKLCGIDARELEDGFEIEGSKMQTATIDSFGDHRIAMSFAVAGLNVGMKIKDIDCIKTSFPNFINILKDIGVKANEYTIG